MSSADEKGAGSTRRTLTAFTEVERVLKTTQRRALQLFSERGVVDGKALNDWMGRERETVWPTTEFEERETEHVLRIALPGVELNTIELTAGPRELVIRTKSGIDRSRPGNDLAAHRARSRGRSRDVWRRASLPVDFRAENVKATLHNGVLTIVAPKAPAGAEPVATAVIRLNS